MSESVHFLQEGRVRVKVCSLSEFTLAWNFIYTEHHPPHSHSFAQQLPAGLGPCYTQVVTQNVLDEAWSSALLSNSLPGPSGSGINYSRAFSMINPVL